MKRIVVLMLASALAIFGFTVTPAFAQSGHFVGTPTCTITATGLTCSGKGAGFGNEVDEAFLTATSVSAEWQCRNPGGKIAPGQGTELTNVTGEPVSITPSNGNITFEGVTLPAPPPPDPETACPNGNWTIDPTPLSLTFTGVELVFQFEGTTVLSESLGDFTFPTTTA